MWKKSKKGIATPKAEAKVEHWRGSGNVFADLGHPDADQIRRFIEEKGLTQTEAAEAGGLDQPKVSYLLRGWLAGFSVDRLLNILNRRERSVEVRL